MFVFYMAQAEMKTAEQVFSNIYLSPFLYLTVHDWDIVKLITDL